MPVQFSAIEPRGKRRIRLRFDGDLGWDAFSSHTYYVVTCADGAGPSPQVLAAMYLPPSRSMLELVLAQDLVDGGAYSVTVTNVPDSASGTVSGSLSMRIGERRLRPTEAKPQLRDSLLSFLGEDLVWNGDDFVEQPNGDLAIQAGPDVVYSQINSCLETGGLQWDPAHGAKLRQFVDGSAFDLPRATTEAVRAIVRDDRVKQATGEIVDNEIQLAATIVGDQLLNISAPIKVV